MVRLAPTVLFALQTVAQAVELAPVDILLTRTVPHDPSALMTAGPEKGERLAKLQADLALIVEGLEGFASEEDAEPSLKRLRESVEGPEQFKDRAAALDAVYRALAVVDYTWAKRLPDAPCSPEASRAALLKSGSLSSWISSLLGADTDAAAALDRASAATTPNAREYALLRAKARKLSEALGSEKALGGARASLHCRRAGVYETLSAANRSSGLIAASRAAPMDDAFGVYILARQSADGLDVLGGATSIDGAIVTDARLVDSESLVLLRRDVKKPIPVRVERSDSGLALLRADEPVKGLTLAENTPAKDDLIEAVGHPERTGAWTRTRGLVTWVDAGYFQSDAVVDLGMTGGAALTEDGKLAGVFVFRRVRMGAEAFEWPIAVSAPALKSWLDGKPLPATTGTIDIAEAGTTSILTASRPLGERAVIGAHATEAGYEFTDRDGNRAVCVANCGDASPAPKAKPRPRSKSSPRSSYGSDSSAELGRAIGAAMAPVVEDMIFKGIPALFRGIGSLFKSKPKTADTAMSTPPPSPPPPPPKPKCSLAVDSAPEKIGVEAFTVTLRFSCDNSTVRLSGHRVELTAAWDAATPKVIGTTQTDDRGAAKALLQVQNEETKKEKVRRRADDNFSELDRYRPEDDDLEGPSSDGAEARGTGDMPLKALAPVTGAIRILGRGRKLKIAGRLILAGGAGLSPETGGISLIVSVAATEALFSIAGNLAKTDDCSLKPGEDILDRFIDDTKLAPGFLQAHEGPGRGHTIERHVAKSSEYLRIRVKTIEVASSFDNSVNAELAIRSAVMRNLGKISAWISVKDRATLDFPYIGNPSHSIGYAIDQSNSKIQRRHNALIVLKQTDDCRIIILTAYPEK